MPGFGYGINYEHGLFRQAIEDGQQREYPDSWRAQGSPWLIMRRDETLRVPVYGVVEKLGDGDGLATDALDPPARSCSARRTTCRSSSFGGRTVNWLRLYSALASDEFDIGIFHQGDYHRAFEQKLESERVSKVLYPPESTERRQGAAAPAGVLLRRLRAARHRGALPRDPAHASTASPTRSRSS